MADNEIIIDVKADTSGAEKGLKKLESSAKTTGENVGQSLSLGFKIGIGAAVTALAAFGAILSKGIEEAIGQENAINELNSALVRTGQYSQEASLDMQAFAASLQASSTFTDDAVLSNAALIQSLGRLSTDGLKEATQAAADLAAAMNIDLRTASMAVGKAAAGEVGALSRYGFQIKEGATNAETFSNALEALARNQGAAASKLNTFGGALTSLKNSFGEILESLGNIVVKSPVVVAVMKELGVQFLELSKAMSGEEGSDPVGVFTKKILDLVDVLNDSLLGAIATSGRLLTALGREFVITTDLINGVLASVAGSGLPLKDLLENYHNSLKQMNYEMNNPAFTNAIGDSIEKLKIAAATAPNVGEELKNKFLPDPAETQTALDTFLTQNAAFLQQNKALFMQYATETGSFSIQQLQAISEFQASNDAILNEALAKTKARVEQLKALSADLKTTFTTGVATTFQNVGAALAKGQNAFAAFGKGILDIIGSMAIKVGLNIIAQSQALQLLAAAFANPFLAPASLAAGIALVALGGALKAIAGGGGGGESSSSASGASAESAPMGATLASNLQDERQEPGTTVTVNVAGNILDRRETGLEIADIINETFSTNGIVMARGAVV